MPGLFPKEMSDKLFKPGLIAKNYANCTPLESEFSHFEDMPDASEATPVFDPSLELDPKHYSRQCAVLLIRKFGVSSTLLTLARIQPTCVLSMKQCEDMLDVSGKHTPRLDLNKPSETVLNHTTEPAVESIADETPDGAVNSVTPQPVYTPDITLALEYFWSERANTKYFRPERADTGEKGLKAIQNTSYHVDFTEAEIFRPLEDHSGDLDEATNPAEPERTDTGDFGPE